jgi:hypothetical protein
VLARHWERATDALRAFYEGATEFEIRWIMSQQYLSEGDSDSADSQGTAAITVTAGVLVWPVLALIVVRIAIRLI